MTITPLPIEPDQRLDAFVSPYLSGRHRVSAETGASMWVPAWAVQLALLNGVEAE